MSRKRVFVIHRNLAHYFEYFNRIGNLEHKKWYKNLYKLTIWENSKIALQFSYIFLTFAFVEPGSTPLARAEIEIEGFVLIVINVLKIYPNL